MELVSEVGVTLIQSNATDDMVAMAAWVSHDQDNEERLEDRKQVAGLIRFLYNNKHMSPFEHGQFTFKIDVPLFVAREFHRHRTFSYNEVSGRYTLMQPRFWIGDEARIQDGKPGDYYFESGTTDQTALYLQKKRASLDEAWATYESLLEAGIAKEQAREVLPVSLMTQFYATVNPRNLMAFLSLRNESHALKEIQAVAVKMEEIFAKQMPLTYEAYRTARDAEDSSKVNLLTKIRDLENQLVFARAENTALGEVLLEVQQDCVKQKIETDVWREKYEDLYNEPVDSGWSASVDPPAPKPAFDINVLISEGAKHVDAAKIADSIRRVIEFNERRKK